MRITKYGMHGRRAIRLPTRAQSVDAFTLIELILALTILVAVGSLVMPALGRWQRAMPLRQAVQTVKFEMARTRIRAMSDAVPWTVLLGPGGRSLRRFPTFATDNPAADVVELPRGVRIHASGSTAESEQSTALQFQADGTVTDARLVLVDSDGVSQVLIWDRLTGTVRQPMEP